MMRSFIQLINESVKIFLSLYRVLILISLNRISIKFLLRGMELQEIESRQIKNNNYYSLLPLP